MIHHPYRLRLLLLIAVVAVFSGCSSPIASKSITVHDFQSEKVFPYSVGVNAKGGSETSDDSEMSDEEFSKVIVDSLVHSGLFSKVVQGKDADYLLYVTIIDLSHPSMGLDLGAMLEMTWSLKHIASGKMVMQELITSRASATFGDAFGFHKRLSIVKERVVKKNIRQGMKNLSELDL